MQKNVGGYDRAARVVVGPLLVLLGVAVFGGVVELTGMVGLVAATVAVLVGLVLSVTAVTRKCPLNDALGVDTYRGDRETDGSEAGPGTRTD